MAIARVAIPTPTSPGALADYQAILDQLAGVNQALTGRAIADGSTIRAGTIMLIGGVLYKATSDTTITGTPSAYVKVTPSGASATAAFVASLTGVTFNEAYGGYYDGSGNLHAFDEGQAVADGVITAPRTLTGLSAGPRMRTFTASGTFVVPTGVNVVWITGCAAGGNGGAGSGGGGGGGGAGHAVIKKRIAVTPGSSITVTVGAVGADTTFGGLLTLAHGTNGTTGGTAGERAGSGSGGSTAGTGGGGVSGSAAFAFGGKGGVAGVVLGIGYGGGGGGAASPLDETIAGSNGTSGSGTGAGAGGAGGTGGGGGGGGGTGNSSVGGNGGAGNGYGSGGGGGGNTGGGTGGTGGAGGPAILAVEW